MNFLDIKTWLVDDLLVKADRMSMASSLELRVPFLDHKVVEFAFRLPSRLKIRGNTPKYLLKKYMAPMLPPAIINRAKKGFPVPVNSWFRNDLAGFAREILLDPAGPSAGFFRSRRIGAAAGRRTSSAIAASRFTRCWCSTNGIACL